MAPEMLLVLEGFEVISYQTSRCRCALSDILSRQDFAIRLVRITLSTSSSQERM